MFKSLGGLKYLYLCSKPECASYNLERLPKASSLRYLGGKITFLDLASTPSTKQFEYLKKHSTTKTLLSTDVTSIS